MQFKPEVKPDGVRPEIWLALAVADHLHRKLFSQDATVTALTDGTHNPHSLHPKGLAVDLRTRDLTVSQATEWFTRLKNFLDPLGFDVLWEGGTDKLSPAASGAHIHIEYDPKAGDAEPFSTLSL